MANEIVGTLKINHGVDQNGSLIFTVPLQLPPAKTTPEVTLSYHSAANAASAIGTGWTIKGVSTIERAPATIAQDGFRGVINYDSNDRFTLNGQRLISIGNNEYRYELEQWSKVVARGSNPANPDSWIEYLPDGSSRTFGASTDSNIKAIGKSATRVWAVTEIVDAFSNYISYSYINDTSSSSGSGAFYVSQISYGGNRNLNIAHQRQITFSYETRSDVRVKYVGGAKVATDKRLSSIASNVQGKLVHTHRLTYDQAPSTGTSRLVQVALVDASSGATVRPLKFSWVNGNPTVFDSVRSPVVIDPKDSTAQILSLDVSAKGKSDLVIASKRLVSNVQQLHLDVYEPDANGIIPTTPSSTFDGDIGYPTQLLPLDINGDGRSDLLHITKSTSSHTLTVLLSTSNGYQKQQSITFTPEYIGGNFYAGDFEGNGHVGLVYIYQVLKSGTPQIKFVQFVSDGNQFTALPPVEGPLGISVDSVKVVVGDLNGDYAEDVFLMSSKFVSGSSVVNIELLESQNGRLVYRSDQPLVSAGQSIPWVSTISFLPFGADEDGKTSLLVASKDLSGNLQVQMLRSTGPTLLPPAGTITTNIAYSGNITLARTTSPSSVDIVNTFSTLDNKTNVDVLRFFNDTFVRVANVTQPGVSASTVSWADLRGLGRVDCLLATQDFTGKLSIASLPCSTLQPIDYVTGFENGLGAKVNVTYAPLSDRTTYTTDATSRAADNAVGSPLAAINGLSHNVSFTTSLSSSSASPISQVSAQTRSQLVYFPSYVVKQLAHAPYATKPDIVDQSTYTYKNARYGYDGRGWQGFESISKISAVLGSQVTTGYYQQFPFLGQIKNVSSVVANTSTLLQTTTNNWTSVSGNGGKNQYICLASIKDSYYEAGVPTYDVDVTYVNDSFGNITSTTIQSQTSATPLTILSQYENTTSSVWVIGNKTAETVQQGNTVLRQAKYKYFAGSTTQIENSRWIRDNVWSTQTMELDAAGNEITIRGPGQALRRLTYDETYTNCTSSSVFTAADNSLVETATYDLRYEQPIVTTSPNGEVTKVKYDVLGRMVESSLGDVVVTRQEYSVVGNDFRKIEYALLDPSQNTWYQTVSHIDGLNRTWKMEKPQPDDLSTIIYSEFEYDGAGRLTRRARDYFAGTTPVYATAIYDPLSRVVKKTLPAVSADATPVTVTYTYSFTAGTTKVTETRSDGNSANDAVAIQYIQAIPNPDPTAQNFIKNFVIEVVDEVSHSVKTGFDGLGRPTSISDAAGVKLAVGWDGISRVIDRSISQPVGGSPQLISHTTALFEDDVGETTVTNQLTGANAVTTFDWAQRPIKKRTEDETLTFTYDQGGQFPKERLVSVSSTKNIQHHFDYDVHGNLTSDSVSIDGQTYASQYAWSLSGALLKVTNPDGSAIQRSLLTDGQSVQSMNLFDSANTKRASIELAEYSDVFSKPLKCTFGNGIVATSALTSNGSIANLSLNKGGSVLHSQDWKIDSFSRINNHDVKADAIQPDTGNNAFRYNAAGQLTQRTPGASVTASATPDVFSYDQSGNLNQKSGMLFVNNGWQLSEIRNQAGATQFTFKYSDDGNMTSKLDASGAEQRSMKYDSEGKLIQLDGISFVYDYGGRLLKATYPDGKVRIYASQSYELDIAANGEKTHTAYIVQGYRRASLTTSDATSSPTVHYYHTDHLGSTIAVSDNSGSIVTQYEYDPYGKVRVVSGEDISRYKFSGKELIGDIYYYGARFYDPDIGRFLTLDTYPLSLDGIKPSTFNMYAFSRNDPINYIDLNGNVPWWHWLVDIALLVVGVALMFVPGANVLVGIALGAVTGALIGAGISGLTYDIQGQISGESNDKDWGIQLGIGAAIGAIGGAATAGIDAVIPAASFGNLFSSAGTITLKTVGNFVVRNSIRVALQTGLGSGLSALTQVMQNAIDGVPLGEGVAEAAAAGAWQAALIGAVDLGFGFASKEKTAVNKFWQRSGSYDVNPPTLNRTIGKVVTQLARNAAYPVTQVTLNYAGMDKGESQSQTSQAQASQSGQMQNSTGVSSSLAVGSQVYFPRFLPTEKVSIL